MVVFFLLSFFDFDNVVLEFRRFNKRFVLNFLSFFINYLVV